METIDNTGEQFTLYGKNGEIKAIISLPISSLNIEPQHIDEKFIINIDNCDIRNISIVGIDIYKQNSVKPLIINCDRNTKMIELNKKEMKKHNLKILFLNTDSKEGERGSNYKIKLDFELNDGTKQSSFITRTSESGRWRTWFNSNDNTKSKKVFIGIYPCNNRDNPVTTLNISRFEQSKRNYKK